MSILSNPPLNIYDQYQNTYDMNKEDPYKITVRHWHLNEEHSWNQHDHIMYVISLDKHKNVHTCKYEQVSYD